MKYMIHTHSYTAWLLLGLLFFSSCGGEETEPESGPGSGPGPGPEVPIEGATGRERVINDYVNNYLPAGENIDEWTGNSDNCEVGELSDALKRAAAARVNYFRRQVGFPGNLPLNEERSRLCQAAALIMRANGRAPLTHTPPRSYRCWTEDGHAGSGLSNLGISIIRRGPGYAARAVFLFIEDPGANNALTEHRDNILGVAYNAEGRVFIGIGATDVTIAVSIENGPCPGCPPLAPDVILPTRTPDFVSWPPDTYVMDELVYPRWSFHFLKDFPYTATFYEFTSNTSVEMTRKDTGDRIAFRGSLQRPRSISRPLVWKPDLPLKATHPLGSIVDISGEDVTYVIKIMNIGVKERFGVTADTTPLNYTYEVTIVDAQGLPQAQTAQHARTPHVPEASAADVTGQVR